MTLGLKWRLLDIGFVIALLLLAAVPIVFLRASPLWGQPVYLAGLIALFLGTLALWGILLWRDGKSTAATDSPTPSGAKPVNRLTWWQMTLVATLLGAVTVVCFYGPLRFHFWGGADDFINLHGKDYLPWLIDWDHSMNRPFTVLPCVAGQTLTPDRIEGFLWVGAALCWLNGLLLFAILREVLPQARLLPVAAAVLLMIDRSDPSRFFVMWTSNFYWTGMALLLLGAWLFLWSYRRGSRPLLVLACLLLGCSLLTNEGAYPLALVVPLLPWFLKEHRRRLPTWDCAWVGTISLCATRLLCFLAQRGADAYQAHQSGEVFRNPELLWNNLQIHLLPGLTNFSTTGAVSYHWKAAASALALVVGMGCLVAWRVGGVDSPRRRQYLLGLGLGGLAFLLGVAPFLSMPFAFRTQFFAAPGQAVALACALCLVGSFLGRRIGATVVLLTIGLLAANATAESLYEQHQKHRESRVSFDRTVHIFRQIHAVCPNPTPDTLFLLFFDDEGRSPFMCNYCCTLIARRALGAFMVLTQKDGTPLPVIPEFHPDGVTVKQGEDIGFPDKAGYDKVVAFRVAEDDTVTLMRRLPSSLVPGPTGDGYQPLALIRPGPIAEMPYLRYPRWVKPPCDLFEMRDGVVYGRGWGMVESHEGEWSRRIVRGAELFINPLGQCRRDIHLDVHAAQAGPLEVVDADGRVLATAHLDGRRRVCLTVPTDPNCVSLVRLRFPEDVGVLRAFCPVGKGIGTRLVSSGQATAWGTVAGDLSLGANWHPLETYGGLTFRWVANDAELILEADQDSPEDLVLDVQAGPSLGGGLSFRLSLLDLSGKALATADVENREEIRFPIPVGTPAGTVLRLHVEGGGRPARDGETRILNFRVMRCAWRSI